MRTLSAATALLLFAAPLAAQQPVTKDPDIPAAGAPAALPAGWSMRLDRANANPAEAKFVTMGPGYHVTSGPAAIYYRPDMTASGAYTAHATFTQTRAPRHPEAYGIFLGGSDLSGPAQDYLYFIVRGDGKYMIKHRAGSETHTITDWTAHPAVAKQDAAGKATNKLEAVVGADAVEFRVNGQTVQTLPRGPMLKTDGIVGLRVNHNLDVHVADFGVTRR